ncbi:pyridoxamine 5'-phosphate oxidase family protein [Nocardia aobensis]|uniref:Pyridoxamine 5'-phosphate oxidase family protein n=1 Tax=Nocardia aobensis TaxID=257277 RepID=A0ABW6P620_9NOCA|nr:MULTISPECIES: pyridoxamine 5'-phosphate oxidase family protein [Nocardia]
MPTMTRTEREKFLAELHVGVIAVERPDRAPLAVPIWYGYEPGGDVVVWTDAGTVKEKLIRAAGRFSITAQVEQPPYRYVTAEGSVTSIDAASPEVARAIAVRYLGPEEGAEFAEQNLGPDSVVIRMRPERWLSTDYSKQ